jgi:hypothetical protein
MKCEISLPTRVLAEEAEKGLLELVPEAFDADAVARLYGGKPSRVDDKDDPDEDKYYIDENTCIIISTHAQKDRRGWSRFLCGEQKAMSRKKNQTDFAPYYIIVDEASKFIESQRRDIELYHRVTKRVALDGSHSFLVPLQKCPKKAKAGNCGNCVIERYGGSPGYNQYHRRVLRPPGAIQLSKHGVRLREPHDALAVHFGSDLVIEEFVQVGRTLFAAEVLSYLGKPIANDSWRYQAIKYFERNRDGEYPHCEESNREVLSDLLAFSYRPVVTIERPMLDGQTVKPSSLRKRLEEGDANWDKGVLFPTQACGVPSLKLTDLASLASIKEYTGGYGTGVAFLGATFVSDDQDILRTVFPELEEVAYAYPTRKISQLAIVIADDRLGLNSLVSSERDLVTRPLEELGTVVIFAAVQRHAKLLYDGVSRAHPSAFLVTENDKAIALNSHVVGIEPVGTLIAYSRSVLGAGVNVPGLRAAVIDCDAYRPRSSFAPGELSVEAFEAAQAAERAATIAQALGRLPRGEEGKTAAAILLHVDADLAAALKDSEAIRECCDRPVVYAGGDDMQQIMDQCYRWLKAGGGAWPDPDPGRARTRDLGGRPPDKEANSFEAVIVEARKAAKNGVKFREFHRKKSLSKYLMKEQIDFLREIFK